MILVVMQENPNYPPKIPMDRRWFLFGGVALTLASMFRIPPVSAQVLEQTKKHYEVGSFVARLREEIRSPDTTSETAYVAISTEPGEVRLPYFQPGRMDQTHDPVELVLRTVELNPDVPYTYTGHTHPVQSAKRFSFHYNPEKADRAPVPPSDHDIYRVILNAAEARKKEIEPFRVATVAHDQYGVWVAQPFRSPEQGLRHVPDLGPHELFSKDPTIVSERIKKLESERRSLEKNFITQIVEWLTNDDVAKRFAKDFPPRCVNPESDQVPSTFQEILAIFGIYDRNEIREEELLNCVRLPQEAREYLARLIVSEEILGEGNSFQREKNKESVIYPPRIDLFSPKGTVLEYLLPGEENLDSMRRFRQINRHLIHLSTRFDDLNLYPESRNDRELLATLFNEGSDMNLAFAAFRYVTQTYRSFVEDIMHHDWSAVDSDDAMVQQVRDSDLFLSFQRRTALRMGVGLHYVSHAEYAELLGDTSGRRLEVLLRVH